MAKLKVGIVGATGLAGQQFLASLLDHPWFEVGALSASERSAGKTLREALTDAGGALKWYLPEILPEAIWQMKLHPPRELPTDGLACLFSAVETEPARELEPLYAQRLPVVSAASAFRMEEDVPLLIPPINPDHVQLIDRQRCERGWRGFIAPIPNCTTTGLAVALKPLADAFGLRRVFMTSLQACSGAGRSPGVIALDIVDNVIPFIPGEEEKVARETGKILGALRSDAVIPHALRISCSCTRVPVLEGHTETVFCELERKTDLERVRGALRGFEGSPEVNALPSAPTRWLALHDDPYRPQPRRDRDAGGGMTTSVGRVRPDPAVDNGFKFTLVSHNTKMGAARGALLVAELLKVRGHLG